ncbi:Ig-like domain-containing protein [Gottfriedia sp. NPDC057948]|uniref:Ig-like domain-containing protein n=1 Tax=Gottfriedia sp. NPDC057948 TaxID=3346287 RepID=UPI0036DC4C05
MKSFYLKVGLLSALTISLFAGKANAETPDLNWTSKCPSYDALKQNENPTFQIRNCLLTNAAIAADIPPEVVKAIAWKESYWRQFDAKGQPFNSEFNDGGIGIMQVTDDGYDEKRLKFDIAYNIQIGIDILKQKYNWPILPKIIGATPEVIENWYFPVMAYNGIKPPNSPIIKTKGEKYGQINTDAYQEKVFKMIEDESYLDNPLVKLARYPFTVNDFDYNPEKNDNIKFRVTEYTLQDEIHKSNYSLKIGDQVAVTRNDVGFRNAAGGDVITRVNLGTQLFITGNFEYDNDEYSKNQFVWYPVKTVNGKLKGYISSAYIKKVPDVTPPIVSGIRNNQYTNKNVVIEFNEGKAMLNNIAINNGSIISKEGNYTLVVKDVAGNTTTVKFTIDKTKPSIPTLNNVTDQMTSITGKAQPNSVVNLYINSKYSKSVTSTPTGNYTIKITKQRSGTKINVNVVDKAQNISDFSRTVIVADKTPPSKPIVNKVTHKSISVTGKAEKGATVYVYNGKTYLNKSIVSSNGNFSVKIKPQKQNSTLKVYAVDKASNKSGDTYVKVY